VDIRSFLQRAVKGVILAYDWNVLLRFVPTTRSKRCESCMRLIYLMFLLNVDIGSILQHAVKGVILDCGWNVLLTVDCGSCLQRAVKSVNLACSLFT
jgi:hypothetical protein